MLLCSCGTEIKKSYTKVCPGCGNARTGYDWPEAVVRWNKGKFERRDETIGETGI